MIRKIIVLLILINLSLIKSSKNTNKNLLSKKRILVIGDSWGALSPGTKAFKKELDKNNCLYRFKNIAISGSTAKDWCQKEKLKEVKEQAKKSDIIWITLMGNDAFMEMPYCALLGKSSNECGNLMMNHSLERMNKILDNIYDSNSEIEVVGFGYDTMFGGIGCNILTKFLFPQCWKEKNPIRCFNTQFIRLQEAWEILSSNRKYVTSINLLGTTQIAYGVENVSIGNPDLDKFGPRKYWPTTIGCIHPSLFNANEYSGANIIMKEFYNQYWKKVLNC